MVCAIGAAVATGAISVYHHVSRQARRKKDASVIHGACTWCGMHCALDVYHRNGMVITVEGAGKSPVNRGMLCPKGMEAGRDLFGRLSSSPVIYSGVTASVVSHDEASSRAAELIKGERDRSFVTVRSGIMYNRLETVASVCGNQVANEDAYLLNKMSRLCGMTDVGTQNLLQTNDSERALTATFGISAQCAPWHDIRNSDCVLIIGSNPVRTTPVVMAHITKAREAGASIITVSPDLNETSVLSDLHITIRPGTDIYFILGLIRYSLINEKYNTGYIVQNTDAPFLVNEDFLAQSDGMHFPGYDRNRGAYTDMTSWSYVIDERGNPRTDNNLNRKNCVFQILKERYARFTPTTVVAETGCDAESFLRAADIFFGTADANRSASILYGGGFTASAGIQGVRALSMLQLLAGNIGIPGGGIYGMNRRGNAQGVSDQIGEWNMLPGYLPLPNADANEDYASYIKSNSRKSNDSKSRNLWNSFQGYCDSLLASWFTGQPESSVNLLPRRDDSFTAVSFLEKCYSPGGYRGLLLLDADLLDTGYNSQAMKSALAGLDWVILLRSAPNRTARHLRSAARDAGVEFIDIPVTIHPLTGTSTTSSDRLISGNLDTDPDTSANNVFSVLNRIYTSIASDYTQSGGVFTDPFTRARWEHESYRDIRREIEGYTENPKDIGFAFQELLPGGKTPCGNWLYYGIYTTVQNRGNTPGTGNGSSVYPGYSVSWPSNSRVLFNRTMPQSEKMAAIADDVSLSYDTGDARPFYFSSEGAARFFARIPEGPIPMPRTVTDNNSASYYVYGRDSGEVRFSAESRLYDEIYAGECVRMHTDNARQSGMRSGETVTVAGVFGSVTLPLVAVNRSDLKGGLLEISGMGMNAILKPADRLHDTGLYRVTVSRSE